MAFVLDASVTLQWCFEDERDAFADSTLDELARTDAVAPAIWPLEVSNGLLVGERRRRLTRHRVDAFLGVIESLPITVEASASLHVMPSLLSLARKHKLSAYDASYLDLAMRLGLPLATQDRRLRNAARSAGIALAQPTRRR